MDKHECCFITAGFSDFVVGQLQLWRNRIAEVALLPDPLLPRRKVFTRKNEVGWVENYTSAAGEEFWKTFPKNYELEGNSLIDGRKLRALAERVGYPDAETLNQVCEDLMRGADIGCTGDFRLASRSSNYVTSFNQLVLFISAQRTMIKKIMTSAPVAASFVLTLFTVKL